MLRIENVTPTAREMRPLQRGWGMIHWVVCLPTYIPILGLLALGITMAILVGDILPPMLLSGILCGTSVAWWLGWRWAHSLTLAATRKSPVGGLPWIWTLDPQGLVFENALQTNRLDWRGVRAVREERDRFVFLVSPQYNPVLPRRLLSQDQIAELLALLAQVKSEGRLGRGVD
jgi:hypothetical protein